MPGFINPPPNDPPLPAGEGWGEGKICERALRSPCKCPVIVFISLIRFRGFIAEGEIKRGSFANRGLRPDQSAMALDDPLHRRQTHAGAGKFGLRMQSPEGAKQLVRVSHVKTRAVVPHEIN